MSLKALTALAVLSALGLAAASDTPEVTLHEPSPEIPDPRVGCRADVSGTARLAPGQHLWVMVVIDDFQGVYYPQSEGKIDPNTGAWRVSAQFGEERDIGHKFIIALAVVDQAEHQKLNNYRLRAMTSGDWRPIVMPPTVGPPIFKTVMKSAHECE